MSHWFYQLERYRDYNLYLLLACLIVDVTTNIRINDTVTQTGINIPCISSTS